MSLMAGVVVENSGTAIIKKGGLGTVVKHNVVKQKNSKLECALLISSISPPEVAVIGVRPILDEQVLVIVVYDPLSNEVVPAPADLEVKWKVYNVKKRR